MSFLKQERFWLFQRFCHGCLDQSCLTEFFHFSVITHIYQEWLIMGPSIMIMIVMVLTHKLKDARLVLWCQIKMKDIFLSGETAFLSHDYSKDLRLTGWPSLTSHKPRWIVLKSCTRPCRNQMIRKISWITSYLNQNQLN